MDDFYSQLPAEERMAADASAEWIIELLTSRAKELKQPFTPEQVWILKHPHWEFSDEIRVAVLETNNLAVELIRRVVLEQVSHGYPSMRVRNGLWIPTEFELHYEILFTTQHNWFISTVLQNAFLGNPLNGERKEWSPNNEPKTYSGSPPKQTFGPTAARRTRYWGRTNQVVFFTVAALLVFVFLAVLGVAISNISKGSNSASNSSISAAEAPASIPAGYSDSGIFGWKLESRPSCPTGKACTQVNVFAKVTCAENVWIYWNFTPNGSSTPQASQISIPAMAKGQTATATLTNSGTTAGTNRITKITCGKTS